MPGPALPQISRHCRAMLLAAAWLFTLPAAAQVCKGEIGPIAQPVDGERFGMIAEQCASLAAPLIPHRAAQLDLYDRPTAPITLEAAPATPAPGPAARPGLSAGRSDVEARRALPPPSRDALRVIALTPALTDAAREYQIDPLLLHAVAHIESRHNTQAVSHAGARGVMQMMPATAKRFGVDKPEQSLHNADVNLRASAAYLQQLRIRYGDDLRLTLAAYNAGEGAVAKYGGVPPYPETQAYVRNVMDVYRRLTDAFTVSRTGQLIARGDKS